MNAVIRELYESRIAKDGDGNPVDIGLSPIGYNEGKALYDFVCNINAKKTMEIGMAYGMSALFMCQAHRDKNIGGSHVAIDPEQSTYFKSIGKINVKRAGLAEYLQIYEGPSYDVMPQLLKKEERFDLVFIDGMHTFDYALLDFFFADQLLRPGGYVIFDDVWMPAIRKVLMYVLRNRHYRLEPQLFGSSAPLLTRAWQFLQNDPGARYKLKLAAKYILRNPLDFESLTSALSLSLKGGLYYWAVQKVSDDNREWNHHRSF